jgi:hypothetical protein
MIADMVAAPSLHKLSSRGLKPIAELARQRPHGDRLRYQAGCRCPACRGANTAYERMRARARKAGLGNPIVIASEARAHLQALSAAGVGRKTVAAATDISEAILYMIMAGTREKIRQATAHKILAVTPECKADGACIDAAPTWALVEELLKAGDTKLSIARGIGQKGSGLQLSRKLITVRNADLVRRHHARRMAEIATARERAQADAERNAPVPAGATRQRLEWLREELGHPKRVARAIGCTEDELRQVCAARSFKARTKPTVPRAFADQVEAAFRRLQA